MSGEPFAWAVASRATGKVIATSGLDGELMTEQSAKRSADFTRDFVAVPIYRHAPSIAEHPAVRAVVDAYRSEADIAVILDAVRALAEVAP